MSGDAAQPRLAAIGLGLGRSYVVAVGTAHPRKNLPRVIEAVRQVRSSEPDLELVLCGPIGADDEAIGRAIKDAAAQGWVRMVGYVSDEALQALYSTARVVVCASLYEGFGLPVLEAMACGAVVVASSTTAVSEAAGDAAVAVDPTDVTSIAAGIEVALNDEELRTTLRDRAGTHVAGFDWDRTAAATVDVYRVALEPHHSAARSR